MNVASKLITGTLRKMRVEASSPVNYFLRLDDQDVHLNPYLGKKICLRFTGEIHCIQCGRKTSKSFQQGFCFPCMRKLQECDMCVIHPERCHVEEGTCPEDDWAHAQCNQQHIIYLANTSKLKIGITRVTNVPSRWVDQGASQALPVFQVENRYRSGLVEVMFKQHVADKTDWRAMLRGAATPLDLYHERDRLLALVQDELKQLQQASSVVTLDDAKMVELNYPVLEYPEKIKSFSFDKAEQVQGELRGIKGQYLIFTEGVINIRKFGGYQIEFA